MAEENKGPAALKEVVPAEYHDRAYLKELLGKPQTPETFAEVFKKLDGAETLVGKKTGVPGADAKPEEVEKFYSSLRPEKDLDYEVKTKEGADEEFIKVLRSAFHTAGLSKHQAAKFQEKFHSFLEAREQKALAEQKKLDVEFETLSKATFGGEHEKVFEAVKVALDENVPDTLKAQLPKLGNTELMIVAGVVHSILKKYVSEDKLNGKSDTSVNVPNLREEGRKLMASEEYKNVLHPKHEETKKKVQEIYAQIGKAGK